MVTPSYFQALGIDLAGRALERTDVAGSPPVMVVNETLAKRDFPNVSAIGQRILVQQIVPGQTALGSEIAWEIVGVIKDEKLSSLNEPGAAAMYVSMEQSPVYFVGLLARAAVEPETLEKAVRAAIASVNKDQALADVRTLEQITDQSLVGNRLQTTLLAVFAGMALLLADCRHLRGDGVCGHATHARARHPRSARRQREQLASARVPQRHDARRDRPPDRARRFARREQVDSGAAVRRRRARSVDDRGRRSRARCGCRSGLLRAGAARDQDRPDRGAALPVRERSHFTAVASISIMRPGNASFATPSNVPDGWHPAAIRRLANTSAALKNPSTSVV